MIAQIVFVLSNSGSGGGGEGRGGSCGRGLSPSAVFLKVNELFIVVELSLLRLDDKTKWLILRI